MQIKNAVIVCIGDELLIGQVVDTNSVWMAQELEKLGVQTIEKRVVSDEKAAIIQTLEDTITLADLVIFTGGLGPTKDDVTKFALCEYFDAKMIRNQLVHEHVQHFFKKRNRPMLPVNDAQADVPDNCTILFNAIGTAPGMLFEKEATWIVSMPGVPKEMKTICKDELFPRIQSKTFHNQHLLHQHLLIYGRGESFVANDIEDIESALPAHLHLAYLPNNWELRLRLSGKGDDFMQLRQEMDTYMSLIKERLQDYVMADKDVSMAGSLVEKLKYLRMTVSTAESCTGGLVGSKITEINGSSEVYLGSIVSYSNTMKNTILQVSEATLETVGAVSEDTVVQMAKQCRNIMKTDFAVSISGILGPSGGTETKPVGLVWFAVDGITGIHTYQYQFPSDRLINKELAANTAIYLLMKQLKAYEDLH